jgi:NAD(P)-dependent dehydrogenase (short-subunit alcohol dehydrogenase family)
VLNVNLWGVINGVQTFTQAMIDQHSPCAIVNTGSKQGITFPPGDTAYNISKAGVKVLTEGLAHALRNVEGSEITAHLLVPGSTFTGMTRRGRTTKPPGSWVPEQVIDMLVAGMAAGDFYIICPDNDVTRDIDNRRILWAAEDIIRNRPALSRWHPDYKDEFAAVGAIFTEVAASQYYKPRRPYTGGAVTPDISHPPQPVTPVLPSVRVALVVKRTRSHR